MASVKINGWLLNLRGASGDIVFKQAYGRLIVSQKPKFPAPAPTEKQLGVQQKFKAGARYATGVMADPALRAPYDAQAAATHGNPFGLAVRDYVVLPEVKEIDLGSYHGQIGDPIRVIASDDFKLVSLTVSIRSEAGVVLESGRAATNVEGIWVYVATTIAPPNQTVTIEAEAQDRPGHQRTLSEAWHS
jgi:hypothetical protein